MGGSLGARTINEAIGSNLEKFVENKIQLIWQTGRNYFVEAKLQAEKYKNKGIVVIEFISSMNLAYAASDFVVSRAGASSISELCYLKKPTILIPSPNVTGDHQTKNAQALVNKNAVIIVKDVEAQENLVKTIIELVDSEYKQKQLKENMKLFLAWTEE